MSQRVSVVDEEAAEPTVLERFDTVQQAEDWIEGQTKVDREKVERGGYGIDAPEELINP